MTTKAIFLSLFVLLFLNACSSLDVSSLNAQSRYDIESVIIGDYISDTDDNNSPKTQDSSTNELDPIMESTRRVLQTSQSEANVKKHIDEYRTYQYTKPEFDNVWDRLPGLFQFSGINNQRVQSHQKWFLKHKKYLEKVSKRASPFLYLITEEVEKRNIPGEIALLPIIESAFKTQAYSKAKAAGLWQFVPATGRHFGLKQNWWFDGRRDVYLSTNAALTYLEQLNKYYKGDWMLALAAYNAGAGNVNKAVRKNRKKGKPIDFWSLDLPKETRNYVPKLLAVAKLIQHSKSYSINLFPIDNIPQLMLVDTQSQIDLTVVAKLANISLKEVKNYNPAFNRSATDPNGPFHLLLPIDKVDRFEKNLALLDVADRVQTRRHKIRPGETLSLIAKKYNVSVKALKKANNLKKNRIRTGKYLALPSESEYKTQTSTIASNNTTQALSNSKSTQKYTVKKGDSFWKIARKFNMSHKKLVSMNKLSSKATLSIGQTLMVNSVIDARKTPKAQGSSDSNIASVEKTATTTKVVAVTSSKNSIRNRSTKNQPAKKEKRKQISYKVKQGDSLYVISKRFRVTIKELKHWNKLSSRNLLRTGQELKVYISDTRAI